MPYEGDNFVNSKMDHFSLIFKTLKHYWNVFYANAEQESIFEGKKSLGLAQNVPLTPIFKALSYKHHCHATIAMLQLQSEETLLKSSRVERRETSVSRRYVNTILINA